MKLNNCGCTDITDCQTVSDGTCKVLISSDCVDNVNIDLPFSNIVKGQTLSEVLLQLDAYIKTLSDESGTGTIVLQNIGGGLELYKGIDSLTGYRKIRTLAEGGLIDLTEGADTITIAVNQEALAALIVANTPEIVAPNGSETKLTPGTNVTITGVGTVASPYVINGVAPNGSETKLNSGSNVTITGSGTIASPYIINSTASGTSTANGSETKLTQGSNITITGTGTIASPYVINSTAAGVSTADGSETKLTQGSNITITGSGTTASPYVINGAATQTVNLQKVLVYPTDFTGINYTLTNADNNYELIIDNGVTAVTITTPAGLTSKIGVGFTQKGTGDVSYIASGTTINTPVGMKIKGQFNQTYLSQEGSTNIFYLGGNTKI